MSTQTQASLHKPVEKFDVFGYGLAIGGAILFSTKGIFIKLAYEQGVGTEMLLALRMLVALPVYVVIFIYLITRHPELKAKLTPKTVGLTMAVGVLGYFFSSYLDFSALNYVSAQYGRLVLFTYPFFVLIFGVTLFGDKMIWPVVPAMLVSYLGLMVIFGLNLASNPDGLVVGTLLVLSAAITFALYQHLARARMRLIGAAMFTCIGMATAAVAAISQSAVVNGVSAFGELAPIIWYYGLALGLLCTVLPSFLMNAGMARIGARATASTAAFGPIVTIIIAVIVLGEPFTIFHAIGTALVIVGTIMFGRAENRARLAG